MPGIVFRQHGRECHATGQVHRRRRPAFAGARGRHPAMDIPFMRHKRERFNGPWHGAHGQLAEARAKADEARRILAQGLGPYRPSARRAATKPRPPPGSRRYASARLYLGRNEARWSNAKHRREWESSLDRFVHPVIGNVAADDLEVAHVLRVVEPIWQRIPDTARRVLGRLEELIDFARVAGLRSKDANPARWRGHLDAVLPAPRRIKPKVHHAAMHYRDLPAFMAGLRGEQGVPRAPNLSC